MASQWREVLEAVQRLNSKGKEITSDSVAREAKLRATARSLPYQLASGYLVNLWRWGYVKRAGKAQGDENRRWNRRYELTAYGKRFKVKW